MMATALKLAERGIPSFPCTTRKRPTTTRGLLDATTDPATIRSWHWENIAIPTGRASGLTVVDVDGEEGADSLAALERVHGPLPPTTTVLTPRGGGSQHLYFRAPETPIRSSAGKIGPGIDVRGDGGYVLVPPSIGTNGRRYEWDDEVPPAAMPAWLREVAGCRRAGDHTPPEPASTWVGMVANGLPEGQRNSGLARLLGHLFAKDIDPHLAAAIAHLVNTRGRPPLPADEVDRVIESIAARELAKRTGQR